MPACDGVIDEPDGTMQVISVATLITMVIVAATNVLSLLSAAIIATFIMVGCKCITMEDLTLTRPSPTIGDLTLT